MFDIKKKMNVEFAFQTNAMSTSVVIQSVKNKYIFFILFCTWNDRDS